MVKKYLKRYLGIVVAMILVISQGVFINAEENAPNGIYKLPIKLMKKYDEETSMGNPALVQYGLLKIEDGKAKMKVRFKPLSMFNFSGYLGEFMVKGEPVKILNFYDVYDGYNDPVKGIDPKFKGKKYPKDMEFDIILNEGEIPVHVYVPVMGEMASGDQDARLRVDWSNYLQNKVDSYDMDTAKLVSGQEQPIEKPTEDTESIEEEIITPTEGNDEDNRAYRDGRNLPPLEKGEPLKLEDGLYNVNIQLYHERENKLSMGNSAMVKNAEIYVKDNKPLFLLGSDKIKVSNIVASLVSLQIRDDDEYYHFAKPYAYDLTIEGEQEKRPEVFSFDINRKDDFIYVKVDPKVKPMGEKPVGARLKIDWSTLKKINENQAILYKKMLNGTQKKKFDPNAIIQKQSDDMILTAPGGSFDEDIKFKYSKVTGGPSYINFTKKLGRTIPVNIYDFKVENVYGDSLLPKKTVKISLPLKMKKKVKKVVYVDDSSSIDFTVSGNNIEINVDRFGEIAIVYEGSKSSNTSGTIASKPSKSKKKTTIKKSKKVSKKSNKKSDKKDDKKVDKKENKKKEKSETSSKVKKSSKPAVLTNDKGDFNNQGGQCEVIETEDSIQEQVVETKENPKVIFFCLIFLIALISLAVYSYRNFSEKLLYEIKLSKQLKKKIAENGGSYEK